MHSRIPSDVEQLSRTEVERIRTGLNKGDGDWVLRAGKRGQNPDVARTDDDGPILASRGTPAIDDVLNTSDDLQLVFGGVTSLGDLAPLGNLSRLSVVVLQGRSLADLRPFESLAKVTDLEIVIHGCLKIDDLSSFGTLHGLRALSLLDCGQVRNLGPLAGCTLGSVLADGPLPIVDATRITRLILTAIERHHRRGFFSLPICPENIILARDEYQEVAILTRSNAIPRDYLAPERRASDDSGDERADIYAVGVLLYLLLTGDLPLGRFALPSERIDECPSSIDHIIITALARSRENRFRNTEELISAITSVEVGLHHRVQGLQALLCQGRIREIPHRLSRDSTSRDAASRTSVLSQRSVPYGPSFSLPQNRLHRSQTSNHWECSYGSPSLILTVTRRLVRSTRCRIAVGLLGSA